MTRRRLAAEDGSILIHVALSLLVLMAFTMFVFDYGVMWTGRGQAQNAADAGALAGATALAFDDFDDRTDTGAAKTSAQGMSQLNFIWSEAPDVDVTTDVTFPTDPAVCADDSCIRVNVYRNQARQNPLPVFFGSAVGVTEQGVRAMAIARAAVANASDCLKPWAIPDKWRDVHDVHAPIDVNTWTPEDRFELVVESGRGRGAPLPNPDVYLAPSQSGPGTGFTASGPNNDLGARIVLKNGNPNQAIRPGWFFPIDLPKAGGGPITGGAKYRANIASCNGTVIDVTSTLQVEPGNMVGPTSQGVDDLIALDPDAEWDPVARKVVNSCAQAATPCAPRSPRVVAIPVFNTSVYELGRQGGRTDLVIVNVLGFFIEEMDGNDVVGYLTTAPGLVAGTAPFNANSSFLKTVLLVR
jgi:Flp pilus assembly protein TadG